MDTSANTQLPEQIRRCARQMGQQGVSALEQLYELTARRVVRYALVVTRNREDAEDAMQAAMVRVAVNPKALAAAHHPWAYFLRVVRNEALKIVRRRRPTQLLSRLNEPGDMDNVVECDDSRRFVRMALKRLPSDQSEVVVLKIWEDMTFAEIADVLSLSPNTVASRYRYALQKLTRLLQPLHVEVS